MTVRSHIQFLAQNLRHSSWEKVNPRARRPRLVALQNAVNNKSLPVYWPRDPRVTNFGDELTALMISKLTGIDVHWTSLKNPCLVGAGSVLGWVDSEPCQGSRVIWGTGLMHEESRVSLPHDRIVSVRGTLTRDRIDSRYSASNDIGLGDPGLLASEAFPHSRPQQAVNVLLIPHLADRNVPIIRHLASLHPEITVLDLSADPRKICAQISQARIVLSSALHPLIVADSYGVPNAWLPLSQHVHGGDFKFRDYYSVYDIDPDPVDVNRLLSSFAFTCSHIIDHYKLPDLLHRKQHVRDSLHRSIELVKSSP